VVKATVDNYRQNAESSGLILRENALAENNGPIGPVEQSK
jgi:hypothetical protein